MSPKKPQSDKNNQKANKTDENQQQNSTPEPKKQTGNANDSGQNGKGKVTPPVPSPVTLASSKKPKNGKKSPKVLFILKQRGLPYYDIESNTYTTSSGLFNSAKFIVDMLNAAGITTVFEDIIDNNMIDRVVTKHKPTHVIVEALWVVPEKFAVLAKLHPNVKWIVRIHSELPFLAQEGVSMEWVFEYLKYPNVSIAMNSDRAHRDITTLASIVFPTMTAAELATRVLFLPNYYPLTFNDAIVGRKNQDPTVINVGCFGAIRPLKDQLIQLGAAVAYAKKHGVKLNYHINGDRVEMKGDNVFKNIVELFDELPPEQFQLFLHPWLARDKFLTLVRTMDIGLQVSFTETFNIVAADFVSNGIPVVVSDQIIWVSPMFYASTTDMADIVEKMEVALWWKKYVPFMSPNENGLTKYSKMSQTTWVNFLTN